jgi:hypothetical protein
MKPWPVELQKRFPIHAGYWGGVPERPWWRGNLKPGGMLFRQPGEDGINVEWRQSSDAKCAYVRFPSNARDHSFSVVYSPTEDHSISEFGEEAIRDFGENYDATMPMATREDVLALLERLDRERPLPHPGFRVGQIWAGENGRAWPVMGLEHPTADGPKPMIIENTPTGLKSYTFPQVELYLVADPACPHLAPWSPA